MTATAAATATATAMAMATAMKTAKVTAAGGDGDCNGKHLQSRDVFEKYKHNLVGVVKEQLN